MPGGHWRIYTHPSFGHGPAWIRRWGDIFYHRLLRQSIIEALWGKRHLGKSILLQRTFGNMVGTHFHAHNLHLNVDFKSQQLWISNIFFNQNDNMLCPATSGFKVTIISCTSVVFTRWVLFGWHVGRGLCLLVLCNMFPDHTIWFSRISLAYGVPAMHLFRRLSIQAHLIFW